jgi:23S rRNA pseudouridine1911/1915/1917 synthase
MRTPASKNPEARATLAALGRPALHAAHLTFTHPATGQKIDLESPLPPDLARLLDALRV